MLEAANTSETLVNFYQTAWHNNPEDSHLQYSSVHQSHLQRYSEKIKVAMQKAMAVIVCDV
jgi:hypothetical protein